MSNFLAADEQELVRLMTAYGTDIKRLCLCLLNDSYLAEDALERPELLTGRKLVVLAFFRTLDARRAEFIRTLAAKGVSLVFLSETGLEGDASALGFRPRRLPRTRYTRNR